MPNMSKCRDRQASNTRNNLLKYSLALGKTGKTTVKANAATYLKYFTLNLDLVAKTKLMLLKMARIFLAKRHNFCCHYLRHLDSRHLMEHSILYPITMSIYTTLLMTPGAFSTDFTRVSPIYSIQWLRDRYEVL